MMPMAWYTPLVGVPESNAVAATKTQALSMYGVNINGRLTRQRLEASIHVNMLCTWCENQCEHG
jgi:hypothetical protein